MKSEAAEDPSLSPAKPSGRRKPGDWQTRYGDPVSKRAIHSEAVYLGVWLVLCLVLLCLLLLGALQQWLGLSAKTIPHFNLCVGTLLAGTLGGSLFAIKWLYRAVARNTWSIDRRLWRLFTPLISGVFALVVIHVVKSGLFGFFNPSAVDNLSFVIALGFLSGYASDRAAGKLIERATSVLGPIEKHDREE